MVSMPSGRSLRRDTACAARIPERQLLVGLEEALWESGPNPLTDFADALVLDGVPVMPADEKARWESLGRFREALTRFLDGKEAVFIGGVAVRSYGGRFRMPLRPTGDWDLLIDEPFLKDLTSFLEREGAEILGTNEEAYFFFVRPAWIHLDVTAARTPLLREVLRTAAEATFQGRKLRLPTTTALAAMKVKAYAERQDPDKRAVDRSDVLGLLKVGATTETEIRQLIEKVQPDLVRALDEILA